MVVLALCRLALGCVFAVAAAAKFADPSGTRKMLEQFGVPPALAPAAPLLPASEALVAIALLLPPACRIAALAALALLIAFSAIVSMQLLAGRRPACACFGAVGDKPVGAATLLRNAALALLTLPLILAGDNAGAWRLAALIPGIGFEEAVSTALALLFVGQIVLAMRVFAKSSAPAEAVQAPPDGAFVPPAGLPRGMPAPGFTLPALGGGEVSLAELRAGAAEVLLVFVSRNCEPCRALSPELSLWQDFARPNLRVVRIAEGGYQPDELAGPLLIDAGSAVSKLYGIWGTPTAILVGADGRIALAPAQGASEIRALYYAALSRAAEPQIEKAS